MTLSDIVYVLGSVALGALGGLLVATVQHFWRRRRARGRERSST